MCRDKSCGGRRCPADTSDARRVRRYSESAVALADDGAVASSGRGTDGTSEIPPAPNTPTVESIRAEAQQYHGLEQRMEAVRAEYVDMLTNDYERLATEGGAALAAKHGIPEDVVQYRGGPDSLEPVLDYERFEQAATRIGADADQWLDTQLAPERSDHEHHVELMDRLLTEVREDGKEFARLKKYERETEDPEEKAALRAARDDLTEKRKQKNSQLPAASQALHDSRERYFDRKRELLGQLRETGATLEWTTAGVRTPAKTKAEVDEAIQHAAGMLPSDWINESNRVVTDDAYRERVNEARRKDGKREIHPVRVMKSRDRNHYQFAGGRGKTVKEQATEWRSSRTHGVSQESIEREVNNSPHYDLVPQSEWTAQDHARAAKSSGVVVKTREFTVAAPGSRLLDENGSPKTYGKPGPQWEQYSYTRPNGSTGTVWRRPKESTRTAEQVAELTIPMDDPKGSSTTVHELTHRCENVNLTIGQLEGAFVRRRTTNADGSRQDVEAYGNTGKLTRERVRPDDFVDRYIGKDYGNDNQSHEVLSMGHEMALKGAYGGFGKLRETQMSHLRDRNVRDDDHHRFTLGAWLTA